ncbi:hypothetical protein [Thalassobellus citreus]|uniref:hypothetical protein n=1 Tax=Thalassobellus citreus TaxID=3367752 RepID=UPI0037927568
MKLPKNKQKCYNCKFAGKPFKIANTTHLHCEHPKWEKEYKENPDSFSGWETLNEFWNTCSDFKQKESSNVA